MRVQWAIAHPLGAYLDQLEVLVWDNEVPVLFLYTNTAAERGRQMLMLMMQSCYVRDINLTVEIRLLEFSLIQFSGSPVRQM